MVWYKGKWWRFAWTWRPGFAESYDGQGRWLRILGTRFYFLHTRRSPCPLGEETLYKQVYQSALHKGHLHDICVDTAVEAVEVHGKHRVLSQPALTAIVEECLP